MIFCKFVFIKKMKSVLYLVAVVLAGSGFSACKDTVDPPPNNPGSNEPNKLTVVIKPTFNGLPIAYGEFKQISAANDTLRINNAKLLLSNFRFKNNGIATALPVTYAFISGSDNRLSFTINNIPKGDYNNLSFSVGLDSLINHGDPAQWDGEHPLNPMVNNMHWTWAQGYIFMVFEGQYYKQGKPASYSFHMANDVFKKDYSVAAPAFSFSQDKGISKSMEIEWKVDEILKNPSVYSMTADGPLSHSGSTDSGPMYKIHDNIGDMFTITSVK